MILNQLTGKSMMKDYKMKILREFSLNMTSRITKKFHSKSS
jgi:hypothetical protein